MITFNARSRYHREWILCGILGLIVALVFGSTIYADFVQWDDDINIYGNPSVQGLTPANLYWMFTDVQYVRRYMPLGWLSWAVDFELYGINPAGYHLGNLILHYLNTILVFLVLRKLFNAVVSHGQTHFFIPLLGALVWGLHPLRVEPVAWASGRLYCQATCLLLLSLFSYLKSAEGAPHRRRWYGLSVACYAASLLTYPIGLGLLPVLIVLDYYPLRRCRTDWGSWRDAATRKVWTEKLPYLGVAVGMFALTLWCRINSTGLWSKPVSLETFGVHERIMQAFYVWGGYLWKTWLPTGLTPLYGTLAKFNPNNPIFIAQAVLVLGLTALFVWQRRRWPAALATWLCYLILLVPMLGLTEHPHDPSDRYSYVAGIVYAAGIAALFHHWFGRRTKSEAAQEERASTATAHRHSAWAQIIRIGSATVVLFLFGFLSRAQCKIWQSSDTMFLHMIETLGKHPRVADIYHRLGTYRFSVGDYGGAEVALRQAIVRQPRSLVYRAQLGNAMAFQDKMSEAITIYESVIAEAPHHRQTRINLAHALAETGRRPEAETQYRDLLARSPEDGQAHLAYAKFLTGDKRYAEAVRQYVETKRLLPNTDLVYVELARLLLQQGETGPAIQTLQEGIRRAPGAPSPLLALAWIYATNDQPEFRNAAEALAMATRATSLTRGEHASSLDTLAAAYAEGQHFPDAIKVAERALRAATGSPREKAIRERLKLYAAGRPYREAAIRR